MNVVTVATAAQLLVVALSACRSAPPQPRGPLASLAESVVAGQPRLTCRQAVLTSEQRALTGCFAQSHDTIAYFYSDAGGEVVLVGREWKVDRGKIELLWTGLLGTFVKKLGAGHSCLHQDSTAWRIRDYRWQEGNRYTALMQFMPVPDIPDSVLVRLVSGLGTSSCTVLYEVPFLR